MLKMFYIPLLLIQFVCSRLEGIKEADEISISVLGIEYFLTEIFFAIIICLIWRCCNRPSQENNEIHVYAQRRERIPSNQSAPEPFLDTSPQNGNNLVV